MGRHGEHHRLHNGLLLESRALNCRAVFCSEYRNAAEYVSSSTIEYLR